MDWKHERTRMDGIVEWKGGGADPSMGTITHHVCPQTFLREGLGTDREIQVVHCT